VSISSSFEQGNKPPDSIKSGKFLDYLSNYQLELCHFVLHNSGRNTK